MLKKIVTAGLFIAALTLTTTTINAQQANETTISYNKVETNGFVAYIEGDKSVVTSSLEDYFKTTFNSKSSSSKGFNVFKAVSWPDVSTEKLDVYYKVDGKKGKNNVTILVSKGYDNFVSSQNDVATATNVKNWMGTINDKVMVRNNAIAVVASEKALNEAQKEYDKAVKKDNELRKDKENIEKSIASQEKTIADKERVLNEAKAALDRAKAK